MSATSVQFFNLLKTHVGGSLFSPKVPSMILLNADPKPVSFSKIVSEVMDSQQSNGNMAVTTEIVSYQKSKEYWEKVDPTVDGMLGGYASISNRDVSSSANFLSKFFLPRKGEEKSDLGGGINLSKFFLPRKGEEKSDLGGGISHERKKGVVRLALDCGAGIGRVAQRLLLQFADQVDLLEQNQVFLDKSLDFMGSNNSKIGLRICSNLQSFDPKEHDRTYDLIWCQWVTGYLTDEDLTKFFVRCRQCLEPKNGMIVVKDNVTRGDEGTVDMDDSSVTRPKEALTNIFRNAGLELIEQTRQQKFPRGLYPVYMFALRPNRSG